MSIPSSTLTIDGVAYLLADRADAGVHLNELNAYSLFGGYASLSFSEIGAKPEPQFAKGVTVELTIDSTLYFSGIIVDHQWEPTEQGWTIGYTAQCLKYRADRLVPVTATDGTGSAYYNRAPDDQDYIASEAGLTIAQILTRILTVQDTANRLDAIGVGNYTSLSPPTLPSATTSDLSALTIVPPQTVIFSGRGLFNQIEAFLARWMPKYSLYIHPDGTIRFLNVTAFTEETFELGTDPVLLPSIRSTIDGCYSRVVIRGGPEVEPYVASTLDGTAVAAWTSTEQSNWRLTDYLEPKDATSSGSVSGLTSTGCTVDPSDNAVSWALNFWQTREGWIYLYNDSVNGVTVSETRPITSCSALSAGGTATVGWSSSWPLANTGYTRYRIVGRAGSLVDVGRLFYIREPFGDKLGIDTWVGSHLMRRFPLPVTWANNGRTQPTLYATGVICWSTSGNAPFTEIPATVEVVPSLGAVRFTEPVVLPFGNRANLISSGWPAGASTGLPGDVKFIVPYSRGALTAIKPSSGYEGTLYTVDGLEDTDYLDLDSWIYKGDVSSMEALAQQHLDTMKDTVFEGTVTHLGIPTAFDALLPGIKINIDVVNATSPWAAMKAPVLGATLRWDTVGRTGIQHAVTLRFSSRQRPFTADDLYQHPAFAGTSAFGGSDFALSDAALLFGSFDANMVNLYHPRGKLNAAGWTDYQR